MTDDAPVDCSRVQVTYILGHDQHGHPLTTAFGCTGTIQTSAGGHDPGHTRRFVASYTDDPGEGLPSLSDSDQVVLEPTG